jgi:hypothetical protein
MSLSLNDPSIPSPGELNSSDRRSSISNHTAMSPSTLAGRPTVATGDPHHHSRQPSLGDIHNELEQEQEAQVNRMLQMIREQQLQLDALRSQQNPPTDRPSGPNSALVDDSEPETSRRASNSNSNSISFPSIHPALPSGQHPRLVSRQNSSAARSPALAAHISHEPSSSGDWPPSPLEHARRTSIRDESAFYQAETSALTRENQMLRMRIRELEKQLAEVSTSPANTPSTHSHLNESILAAAAEGEGSARL